MTDHELTQQDISDVTGPVGPVGPFEPPYYSVVFTALRTEGDNGYAETSRRMDELVAKVPGFLGADSAGTPGGLGITVAYFRDLDALKEWREDPEHQDARERGRAEWYEQFVVHVGKVERSYGGAREAEAEAVGGGR
ncbi:antibiotic biosynthesis monooxygenase family protein [Streptomyces sp. NRRL B-1347]|uniref:antibiotic biosynthesis monooxygenase family protein n=1 Tax=Streptomyces sp. NRRL B-1347 TaxID=1476877 RepID=UPI00068F9B92|nr:antibiotic biosynthesis monooxygenase [Streptomyces sp. NRRL B-1347]